MIQLDEKKLARLRTTNQQLNEKYGEHGTDTREKFNEKSMAWYYGDILRERRKELKLTQKQLAQKIGKEQSYIARVEKGEVDIQLSSFSALRVRWVSSLRLHLFEVNFIFIEHLLALRQNGEVRSAFFVSASKS